MENLVGRLTKLRISPRRALLIEFACLVPAFSLLALGGFEWGGYFWLQHRAQQAADLALDAALAAPNPLHRAGLARAAAARVLGNEVVDFSLEADIGPPTVRVAYDASASPIFAVGRMVALPPPIIVGMASRP
jgi:Flp pilus assembly protein TadG